MKLETNIHNTSHDCISQAEMIAYIQGKLSAIEMNRIERHLLECEMCNDEFEGLSLLEKPESIIEITTDLNKEILEKISTTKVIAFPIKRIMMVAASIVIIFGLGYVSYWMYSTKKDVVKIASTSIEQKDSVQIIKQKSLQENKQKLPIAVNSIVRNKSMFFIDTNSMIINKQIDIAQVIPTIPSVEVPQIELPNVVISEPSIQVQNKNNNETYSIHGKILDKKTNEPLIGCSIAVRNSTEGTFTEFDGSYELQLKPGTYEIEVSYVGYKTVTQKVVIRNEETIAFNSALEADNQAIESVMKIGYASAKPEDMTGSITQISGNEINSKPVLGVDKALQGKAAGVQVRSNSGAPGAATNIAIRGIGSASGDSRPLYIVDGVPVGNEWKGDPNTVESISILKDASSCAIYGSRGSNGVILITTKGGNAVSSSSNLPSTFIGAKYSQGTKKDFEKYVNQSIPNSAKTSNITVVVYCKIKPDATISVIETDLRNHPELEEKIKSVIELSTDWIPATEYGKNVESSIIFTINLTK